MRSELRTKVAVLRSVMDCSVEEFANLVKKSPYSIKSLESGRLKLSDELAAKISELTNVSLAWLLDDELTGQPVDIAGKPLTRDELQSYVVAAMYKKMPRKRAYAVAYAGFLEGLIEDAAETPHFNLALYRVGKFLTEFQREFFPDRSHEFSVKLLSTLEEAYKKPAEGPKKSAGSKKKRP
jgi:transcriptional regulator with XRE-family HTH domain